MGNTLKGKVLKCEYIELQIQSIAKKPYKPYLNISSIPIFIQWIVEVFRGLILQ